MWRTEGRRAPVFFKAVVKKGAVYVDGEREKL